jgi:hypothetical protein
MSLKRIILSSKPARTDKNIFPNFQEHPRKRRLRKKYRPKPRPPDKPLLIVRAAAKFAADCHYSFFNINHRFRQVSETSLHHLPQ